MGAAGRCDPTAIRIGDLADTRICPLAQEVRKILRTKFAFSPAGLLHSLGIFRRKPRDPIDLHYDDGMGFACVCPGGKTNTIPARNGV